MVSGYKTYKCRNPNNKNPNFNLHRNRKSAQIWKNRINCPDLPKIIALCKENTLKNLASISLSI